MEIKYTLEILTKDIQDIEKLVGKLQNSQDSSAIELDLALSKLRNVYEILTMIKADRLHEIISPQLSEKDSAQTTIVTSAEKVAEEAPEQVEKEAGGRAANKRDEAVKEEAKEEEKEEAKEEAKEAGGRTRNERDEAVKEEVEEEAKEAGGRTTNERDEAVKEEAKEAVKEAMKEEVKEAVKEEVKGADSEKSVGILAEKFSAESSINENLAGQRGSNMDAKLIGQPIDNISRNIGINDRFLIIRELFDGNADKFGHLVNKLEAAGNYQNAFSLLQEEFPASMEHEGVEILSGLVKRRFANH